MQPESEKTIIVKTELKVGKFLHYSYIDKKPIRQISEAEFKNLSTDEYELVGKHYEKPFIPTGSLDTYLILYKELYQKYQERYFIEKDQSIGGKRLREGLGISNVDHFEYYLIEGGWKGMKDMLDKPIVDLAKYKVGDKIKFIKEKWTPKDTPIEDYETLEQKNVECIGVISAVYASWNGNGEVVYDISDLTPACAECNPHALEKNVLELLEN